MSATDPWIARVWREFRAGNLTRAYRDVLLTLRTFRGPGGLICPSHATLAQRAECGVSTVQRALDMAQQLGLLSWAERRIRRGWRWLRTSNRYRLEQPVEPVQPGLRPAWARPSTTGQFGREGDKQENQGASGTKKAVLADMIRQAAGLPDLLAQRRAVMLARLAGRAAA